MKTITYPLLALLLQLLPATGDPGTEARDKNTAWALASSGDATGKYAKIYVDRKKNDLGEPTEATLAELIKNLNDCYKYFDSKNCDPRVVALIEAEKSWATKLRMALTAEPFTQEVVDIAAQAQNERDSTFKTRNQLTKELEPVIAPFRTTSRE